MTDQFKELLREGASPSVVLDSWAEHHAEQAKDEPWRDMIDFNYLLTESSAQNSLPLAEAVCKHERFLAAMERYSLMDLFDLDETDDNEYDEDFEENLYMGGDDDKQICQEFKFITRKSQTSPIFAAVKAKNVEIMRLLVRVGYDPYHALKDLATKDFGKFLLCADVVNLVLDSRNKKDPRKLLKAWKINHGNADTFLPKEQWNWFLSMCVVYGNVAFAKAICHSAMFPNKMVCKYENNSPLALAMKQGESAKDIIHVLLLAGFDPPSSFKDDKANTVYVYGHYYVSDRVQGLVKGGASHTAVLAAWHDDHGKDKENVQMEQFNWLLTQSHTQPNAKTELAYAKAICKHPQFPKPPEAKYVLNSPLYSAVVNNKEDLISLYVQIGYDPSKPYCDSSKIPYTTFRFGEHMNITHTWFRRANVGPHLSLLEELLASGDVNDIKNLLVTHKAVVANKLYLLDMACALSNPDILDSLLSLGIFSASDLNMTEWECSPIFRLQGGVRLVKSLRVLLKHGADPCILHEGKGTMLLMVCSWLRGSGRGSEIDWSETFDLINHLMDKEVDVSEGGQYRNVYSASALHAFCAIPPSNVFPRDAYDAVLDRLARLTNAETRDDVFTSLLRAICFSMSCDDEVELGFPEVHFDMVEICNSDSKPNVEHVEQLHDRAMILVKYGASWSSGKIVTLIHTLSSQHPRFGYSTQNEEARLAYKECAKYLTQLFPYVATHVLEFLDCLMPKSNADIMRHMNLCQILLEDVSVFKRLFYIYLDVLPPAQRKKAIEQTLAFATNHPKGDTDACISSLTAMLHECQAAQSLRVMARTVISGRLATSKQLHRVEELGLPDTLNDFLLYRN